MLVPRMFFSLLPVEKPALGRGLDALMSGGKGSAGNKAADLLSFQAKRTRVGRGLNAFIKREPTPGAPSSPPTPSPQPEPAADMSSMRARRQPKSTPTPATKPALPPNYRRARRPGSGATPAPSLATSEKSEPAPGRLFVGSTNTPTTPRPLTSSSNVQASIPRQAPAAEPEIRRKPEHQRQKKPDPTPAHGAGPTGNPGFRMSLFALDWFLIALAFYVALNIESGSNVVLTLCVLAVLAGAALGVWGLILETEEGED